MKPCLRIAPLAMLPLLLISSSSRAQTSATHMETAARPMEVRPLAPELTQRFTALHGSLQPSAKSWVEQQARAEAQRPAPDLADLQARIRSRFATSLSTAKPSTGQKSASAQIPADADVEALAFVVLMQAANDSEQDLQNIMKEVQAMTAAKQQLRNLVDRVKSEAATASQATAKQPCRTAVCQSLPGELKQLSAISAQSKHPVRLSVPENLTYGQLQPIVKQLDQDLNAMNDMSQQQQLELQMAMDRRSKLEQTLSNIMKKQQDTASSIVSNLK